MSAAEIARRSAISDANLHPPHLWAAMAPFALIAVVILGLAAMLANSEVRNSRLHNASIVDREAIKSQIKRSIADRASLHESIRRIEANMPAVTP